jgi:hypothetical protein
MWSTRTPIITYTRSILTRAPIVLPLWAALTIMTQWTPTTETKMRIARWMELKALLRAMLRWNKSVCFLLYVSFFISLFCSLLELERAVFQINRPTRES